MTKYSISTTQILLLLLPILLTLLSLPNACLAQYYFGKNKIQYANYDWQQLETEHFNIYFYEEEAEIAYIAAAIAEESYDDHLVNFEYDLPDKTPLIIYSAPNLFQETNTVPFILPEGVAGFTEYYKGRIVIPFNGSYADFYHTLKHELVHIFTLYKLQQVLDAHRIFFFEFFPLWFMEGIAEHWSEGKSLDMEMVMRSAILEDYFYPVYSYDITGTYLMYKGAESFLNFLEEKYGQGKLILLFNNWWQSKRLYQIFEDIYGISLEEANEEWKYHLMKKYYPTISEGLLPAMLEHQLTHDGYNVSPRVYYPTDSTYKIIYKSNFMGYTGIYSMVPNGKSELIQKGGMSEPLESLHLFRNSISVNDYGLLTYAAKSKGGDILYVYDLSEEKVIFSKSFSDLTSIQAPTINVACSQIAFAGIDLSGKKDIYRVNIEESKLYKLTDDIYDDSSPCWVAGENKILFTSDRCEGGEQGHSSLYEYNLDDNSIYRLSLPMGTVLSPSVNPQSGAITFSAAFDSFFSIYIIKNNILYKTPRILTGAFEPTWLNDDTLITSIFTRNTYHLFKFPIPESLEIIDTLKKTPAEHNWIPDQYVAEHTKGYSKYNTKLTLDIAQGAVATSAGEQTEGGLEGILSDVLGNHQVYFMFANNAQSLDEIFERTNIFVGYYNLNAQPNWGFGAYHLNEYSYQAGRNFREENSGGFAQISVPLSRFHRVETKIFSEWSERSYSVWHDDEERKDWITSLNLSYIRDAALWASTGPIDGMRANLTCGIKGNVLETKLYNWLASTDLRYYLRVSKYSGLAFRTIARISEGPEPQRFYMGGTWDFRGYPYNSFAGKRLLLINSEYRFPLINRLYINLPILDINLGGIRGALFFDVGEAWEDENEFQLNGSYGFGARFNLAGYTVLRLDLAKRTDFHSIDDEPLYFDFFFGWDY